MLDAHEPKICTYTIRIDAGFAPNPFWGYCTLAACTPNYMGVAKSLRAGNWIVGYSNVRQGRKLVYAMRITNILDFDDYFTDTRFARKKPTQQNRKTKCGDNIYQSVNGRWVQTKGAMHGWAEKDKDTKYPKVFVSKDFYYFGANCPDIPRAFQRLLVGRGCKHRHPQNLANAFLDWLQSEFKKGIHGNPGAWESEYAPDNSCLTRKANC